MFWMGDFSSHANVGSAKSPGTPKQCRTPRRCKYSKRNCPIGMRAGNGGAAGAEDGAASGSTALPLPLRRRAGEEGLFGRCDEPRLIFIRSLYERPPGVLPSKDIIRCRRNLPLDPPIGAPARKKKARRCGPCVNHNLHGPNVS